MVPGLIKEVEGSWIYETDDFGEADAISISARITISQYFPEGDYLGEILQTAVVITEVNSEGELEEW